MATLNHDHLISTQADMLKNMPTNPDCKHYFLVEIGDDGNRLRGWHHGWDADKLTFINQTRMALIGPPI